MHTRIYPSTHLSPNPPIYLSTHSFAHPSISSFIQPVNHSSTHPCFYPLFHPSTLLSPHPPTYLSIYSFSHPTISSFIQPAKCPASIHPSIHLSPNSAISKSLQMVTAVMKLKDAPWKNGYDKPSEHIKKERHHFANKGLLSQSYGFSRSHVWM